jgi:hypothetical protein
VYCWSRCSTYLLFYLPSIARHAAFALRPLRVARAPRWCEGEESLLAVHVRGRGGVRRLARALGPFTATRLFSNERGDLRQWVRYPQTTDGRTVPDANELKLLASRQEQAFHEKFGYPSREVRISCESRWGTCVLRGTPLPSTRMSMCLIRRASGNVVCCLR